MDSQIQYKIVLDVVQAETGATNLNQDLTTTKQKVDQVNSTNLNNLSTSFDKAAKSAKAMSQEVSKASQVNLQLGDTMTDTFQNALSSLDGVSPGIKEMANQVNGAIPIVKSLNSTALTGLKGIKGAIVSTGIGALVVAVGMLAANWDKVTAAVKKFTQSATFQNITNWLSNFGKQLKTLRDKVVGGIAGIGKAITNSIGGVLKALWKAVKLDFKGAGEELANAVDFKKAFQEGSEAATDTLHKIDDFATGVVTKISDKVKANREREHKATLDDLNKEYETARQREDRLHREKLEHLKELLEQRKITEKEYQDYVQKENKRYQEALSKGTKSNTRTQDKVEETTPELKASSIEKNTQDRLKAIQEENKLTQESYKKQIDSLKLQKDLTESKSEQYLIDFKIKNLQIEANNKNTDSLEKQLELTNQIKDATTVLMYDKDTSAEQLKEYQEVYNNITEIQNSLLKQISRAYLDTQDIISTASVDYLKEAKSVLSQFDTSSDLDSKLDKVKSKYQDLMNQVIMLEEILKGSRKGLEAQAEVYQKILDNPTGLDADKIAEIQTKLETTKATIQEIDTTLVNLGKTETTVQDNFNTEEITTYLDAFSGAIEAAQTSIDNLLSVGDGLSSKWGDVFFSMTEGIKAVSTSLASNSEDWEKWSTGAQSSLGFASQLLQAYADEQDTSTEEGFNKQKKLQKASVLLSGLQGSVAAMSNAIRDLGYPAGPITGGIMSAMILALTAKQMQAIDKTSFDNASLGSTSTSGLSATPILSGVNESLPTSTVVTNQDDQRVYILQSDLTKSSKQVQVRESNSTF